MGQPGVLCLVSVGVLLKTCFRGGCPSSFPPAQGLLCPHQHLLFSRLCVVAVLQGGSWPLTVSLMSGDGASFPVPVDLQCVIFGEMSVHSTHFYFSCLVLC